MDFLCEKIDNTYFRIIENYFASMLISRNIIGRNPSIVIPLLANQDLTPMLSQHYWQESFDGDSLVSQLRLDAYASQLASHWSETTQ